MQIFPEVIKKIIAFQTKGAYKTVVSAMGVNRLSLKFCFPRMSDWIVAEAVVSSRILKGNGCDGWDCLKKQMPDGLHLSPTNRGVHTLLLCKFAEVIPSGKKVPAFP